MSQLSDIILFEEEEDLAGTGEQDPSLAETPPLGDAAEGYSAYDGVSDDEIRESVFEEYEGRPREEKAGGYKLGGYGVNVYNTGGDSDLIRAGGLGVYAETNNGRNRYQLGGVGIRAYTQGGRSDSPPEDDGEILDGETIPGNEPIDGEPVLGGDGEVIQDVLGEGYIDAEIVEEGDQLNVGTIRGLLPSADEYYSADEGQDDFVENSTTDAQVASYDDFNDRYEIDASVDFTDAYFQSEGGDISFTDDYGFTDNDFGNGGADFIANEWEDQGIAPPIYPSDRLTEMTPSESSGFTSTFDVNYEQDFAFGGGGI